MLYSVRLELSIDDAKIIASSLKPDDIGWAKSRFENSNLVIEIKTHKIGALINAVEDFFMNIKSAVSCLSYLEKD